MKRILVVNLNFAIDKTAVIDSLERGRVYRMKNVKTMPGGKGVNVARALQTLGAPAALMGFVAGHNGRWITEVLTKDGFNSICVPFSPGESRVCYSIADTNGVSTDFNEEGSPVPRQARDLFVRRYTAALGNCDLAAFCGRLMPGLPVSFFNQLIAIARTKNIACAADTSGAPLRAIVKAGPDLIRINREEFEFMARRPFTAENLGVLYAQASKNGTRHIMVTDGPGPTLAVSDGQLWKFCPPPVTVVTPVGAGDSCMAGLLYSFAAGKTRRKCAEFALGAAASDCLSLGAGIIDAKQCQSLARKVKSVKLGIIEIRNGQVRSANEKNAFAGR
ncbi:MAG: hexose kinase [Elusimicrobiaceae bacterium]|nr:hexose kinase [Elusimicrobiaceae bacterium]